jgi:hypothetical protein
MMDVDQAAKAMKEAEMEAEIEDFHEGLNSDPPRHAGQWGPGGNLVIQRWVVWGRPARIPSGSIRIDGGNVWVRAAVTSHKARPLYLGE